MDMFAASNFALFVVAVLLMGNPSSGTVLSLGQLSSRTNCLVNPCQTTQCFAYPEATCVPDYTSGCNARFYLGRIPILPAECGSVRAGGIILRDDTESEGSARNSPVSSVRRTGSRSSLPSSSRSRQSVSSSSGSRVDDMTQRILERKRQAEAERARQILEYERRLRQQNARPSSSRGRSSSRTRSRGNSRRRSQNNSRNYNNRSRSSQRNRSSGGFFRRLLRG